MTDEAKLGQQRARGKRAKHILDDELVSEAFDKIEQQIDDGWKNSAPDDELGRYNAYLMHRLLQNLKDQFRHIINTGELANQELLQLEKSKSTQ